MKTLIPLFFVFVMPVFAIDQTQELMDGYHEVSKKLAGDAFKDTQNAAGKFITPLNLWLKEATLEAIDRKDVEKMLEGAEKLSQTSSEKELRVYFATLSEGIVGFIRKHRELWPNYQLYFCPMVKTFAYWVQPKGEMIGNPYMGLKMLKCGSKKPW